MSKYISFSLFGNSRLYNQGAIENVYAAQKFFPDWICRFYVSKNAPALHVLKKLNCEIVEMPETDGINREKNDWKWQVENAAMFWRNYIIDELKDDDCVIFRDTDSRLSEREVDPTNSWLNSDYTATRIVECQEHLNGFFLGGLWGVKGGAIRGITESIAKWIDFYPQLNHDWIFIDLLYYTNILGPVLKNSTMSFGWNQPFPLPPCKKEETIGWVVDDHLRNEVFCEY